MKYGRARQATDSITGRRKYAILMSDSSGNNSTDTHSYNLLLIAFPRQKWLLERASVLHAHCLSVLFLKYLSNAQYRISSSSVGPG